MNNTFSPKRFGWLFKKTLFERPAQLAGLVALTLVAVLISYAVCRFIVSWEAAQDFSFIVGLAGGGSFLAAFVFNYFSSNSSGSSYLTLPASHFEKWLCGVLITGVIFTVLFLVFYRIIDITFVSIFHKSLDPKGPFYRELYNSVHILPFDGFVASKTYMMYANFAAAMLVGSLYFNKAAFIKVALIICALFIGGSYFNYYMASAMFDNVDRALPFYAVFIPVGKDFWKK